MITFRYIDIIIHEKSSEAESIIKRMFMSNVKRIVPRSISLTHQKYLCMPFKEDISLVNNFVKYSFIAVQERIQIGRHIRNEISQSSENMRENLDI